MKLPKSITVLGRKFKIKLLTQEKVAEVTGCQYALAGMCYSSKTIVISKGMTKEDTIISLYHELTHCVMYIVGLNQVTDPSIQEVFCESIANCFFDVQKRVRD